MPVSVGLAGNDCFGLLKEISHRGSLLAFLFELYGIPEPVVGESVQTQLHSTVNGSLETVPLFCELKAESACFFLLIVE